MHRPCIIYRVWGIKQHILQVNGRYLSSTQELAAFYLSAIKMYLYHVVNVVKCFVVYYILLILYGQQTFLLVRQQNGTKLYDNWLI